MELTVMRETGKELICFCPYHRDEGTPNFHILKVPHNGFPIGFAKCFACGMAKQFTEEEVKELSKRPATKASKCEKNINWLKIYKNSLEYPGCMNEIAELATEWNVYPNTVLSMGMGWSHEYQAYTGLMYNEDWEVVGIQLRSKDGFKWCVNGSSMGLILPNYNEGNIAYQLKYPTVICEGRSDSVIAHSCGFFPVGKPSAAFGNDLIFSYLKNNTINNVTIIADDCNKPYKDAIGQKAAKSLNILLASKGVQSKVLTLHGFKDLRELYQKKGKEHCKRILSL